MRTFITVLLGHLSAKYRYNYFKTYRKYLWGEKYGEDSKNYPEWFPKMVSHTDYFRTAPPNHKYYYLNLSDMGIYEAEWELAPLLINTDGSIVWKERMIIKDKSLYTSALNVKNAEKNCKQMLDKLKQSKHG